LRERRRTQQLKNCSAIHLSIISDTVSSATVPSHILWWEIFRGPAKRAAIVQPLSSLELRVAASGRTETTGANGSDRAFSRRWASNNSERRIKFSDTHRSSD
jgi:hypothetical protein